MIIDLNLDLHYSKLPMEVGKNFFFFLHSVPNCKKTNNESDHFTMKSKSSKNSFARIVLKLSSIFRQNWSSFWFQIFDLDKVQSFSSY